MGAADASVRPNDVRLQVIAIQGNLCIEFYAQKCERNSIRGRRIFIGFPDKFAKPAFYAGLVSLDFTGVNRCGAPKVQISAVIATQLRKACITQVKQKSRESQSENLMHQRSCGDRNVIITMDALTLLNGFPMKLM